ncbi:MAG: ABC transporter substrate-binding protein [Stellaceae bacterium]
MRRLVIRLFGLLVFLVSMGQGSAASAAEQIYRLGVLSPSAGAIDRIRATMLPELATLGFSEGRNLALETRVGPTGQLPALARGLAAVRPQAVVAVGAAAIDAMRRAAKATPIVGAFIGEDPVAAGFAKSLSHPGGTVTGVVMLAPELDAKRLHLLHEVLPASRRIAVLAVDKERDRPNLTEISAAADRAKVQIFAFYAGHADQYQAAFRAMKITGASALQVISAPELYADAAMIAEAALNAKLPTICEWAEMAQSGCLLGYGPDFTELQHRVANDVARILRGTDPGDLPIEEPKHYVLAVNLNVAKTLGLTISPDVLARADQVIE